MTVMPRAVGRCDGYSVVGPVGPIGSVEEIWLGEAAEPVGLAAKLTDGRRVFVTVRDLSNISAELETVWVRPDARLLTLEPPYLAASWEVGSAPSASWRTTGAAVGLPAASQPSRSTAIAAAD